MVVKMFISCFRWSAEFGAPRGGAPEIHVMLADYMYFASPEVVGSS